MSEASPKMMEDNWERLCEVPPSALRIPEPRLLQLLIEMNSIESWDPRARLRVFSTLGGALFSLAWWIMIDAAVFVDQTNDPLKLVPPLWLPGVGATLMFFIVVLMDWDALYADELTHFRARETRIGARAVLAFAITLGLASLVGAVIVLAEVYAGHKGIDGAIPDSVYPGGAIFVQTFLLFIGAFIARLGRLDLDPY